MGYRIEQALTAVGVTKERVEKFVGAPCGCVERREKLNRLGAWAMRVIGGKTENAEKYLEEIIAEEVKS